MKRSVFLVLLLLIPIVYAQGYSQSSYTVVDINLSAVVDMNYKTSSAKVENFKADLQFIPRNYLNQEVVFFNTHSKPYASIRQGNNIEYRWSNGEERYSYGFDSRVKVKNSIIRIDKKIEFPITGLREEDLEFTKATELVDISPQIKDKANEYL